MRKLLLGILILCVHACAWAQVNYVHDEKFPFIVITNDTVQKLPQFSDQEFFDNSMGVIFKVNRTEILPENEFLKKYREEVLPFINQTHLQLRKVFIRGAASPEGPFDNNYRLGKGRAQTLLNEIRSGLTAQYREIETDVNCVTEDYGYLCLLMKEANDPDYEIVQNIYTRCKGNEIRCKSFLMSEKKGALWPRLLRQYFPKLRSARFMLWFSEPDDEHAPKKEEPDTIAVEEVDTAIVVEPITGPEASGFREFEEDLPRRHLIAARTNLVHDFFYMPNFGFAPSPNIQFEYYPLNGHLTYNIGMTWGTRRLWEDHKFWQVRDFQLEMRRYFKGHGEFIGPYLGVYLQGSKYGIGFDKKRGWQGDAAGAGLTIGHTMSISPKGGWRLEFMVAFGYFYTLFDPYVYGNPITSDEDGKYYYNYLGSASDFRKRNHKLTWLGPTNFGIQITRDIIYRKKHSHSAEEPKSKNKKEKGDAK